MKVQNGAVLGLLLLCPMGRTLVFKVSMLKGKVCPCRNALGFGAILLARNLQGYNFLGCPFGKMLTGATWINRGTVRGQTWVFHLCWHVAGYTGMVAPLLKYWKTYILVDIQQLLCTPPPPLLGLPTLTNAVPGSCSNAAVASFPIAQYLYHSS